MEDERVWLYEKVFKDDDGNYFTMFVKVQINVKSKTGKVLDAWIIYDGEPEETMAC